MNEHALPGALNLNERAAAIADAMIADAEALRIRVSTLDGGTRVLDCGVGAPGGLEAGRRLAEVCLGGLGSVDFTSFELEGLRSVAVQVRTDHPALACLGSQYAGWAIKPEGYFAMGSGPLRALARVEPELYEKLAYAEPKSPRGVLVLESRSAPSEAVAAWVAAKAGLPADRLTLLFAPTATPAAGVQIAARSVETALHKMMTLGFDVRRVLTGFGTAPLAPIAKSDMRAIGRTNDSILYGGVVHLTVQAGDEELEALAPQIPSSASRDYGTPFYDLFKSFGGDFYKVDPHLFSPALITLTSVGSGRTFEAGGLNAAVLKRSFLS